MIYRVLLGAAFALVCVVAQRQVEESDFECLDEYGFYPDPKQCDKYYECRNGTTIEGLCPDGLVFNAKAAPRYLRCDGMRSVDCGSRTELQPAQSRGNCPRLWGMYRDPNDCGRFYNCIEGHENAIDCASGLAYNERKGACDWADQVPGCATESNIGFKCPEGPVNPKPGVYSFFPAEGDCRKHYTCLRGASGKLEPRLLSCDWGLVFDPVKRICDIPNLVPECQDYYKAQEPASTSPRPRPVSRTTQDPKTRLSNRRRPSPRTSSSTTTTTTTTAAPAHEEYEYYDEEEPTASQTSNNEPFVYQEPPPRRG